MSDYRRRLMMAMNRTPIISEKYTISMSHTGVVTFNFNQMNELELKVIPKYQYISSSQGDKTYGISNNDSTEIEYSGVNAKTTVKVDNGIETELTGTTVGDDITYSLKDLSYEKGSVIKIKTIATDKKLNPKDEAVAELTINIATDDYSLVTSHENSYDLAVLDADALTITATPSYIYAKDGLKYNISDNILCDSDPDFKGVYAVAYAKVNSGAAQKLKGTLKGDVLSFNLTSLTYDFKDKISVDIYATDKIGNKIEKTKKNVLINITTPRVVDSYGITLSHNGNGTVNFKEISGLTITATPKYIYNNQDYFIKDNEGNVGVKYMYQGVNAKCVITVKDSSGSKVKSTYAINGTLDNALKKSVRFKLDVINFTSDKCWYGDKIEVKCFATNHDRSEEKLSKTYNLTVNIPKVTDGFKIVTSHKGTIGMTYDELSKFRLTVTPIYVYNGVEYHMSDNNKRLVEYNYQGIDGTEARIHARVNTLINSNLELVSDGDTKIYKVSQSHIDIMKKAHPHMPIEIMTYITNNKSAIEVLNIKIKNVDKYNLNVLGVTSNINYKDINTHKIKVVPSYVYGHDDKTYSITDNTTNKDLIDYEGVYGKLSLDVKRNGALLKHYDLTEEVKNVNTLVFNLENVSCWYGDVLEFKACATDEAKNVKLEKSYTMTVSVPSVVDSYSISSIPSNLIEKNKTTLKTLEIKVTPVYDYNGEYYHISDNERNEKLEYKYRGVGGSATISYYDYKQAKEVSTTLVESRISGDEMIYKVPQNIIDAIEVGTPKNTVISFFATTKSGEIQKSATCNVTIKLVNETNDSYTLDVVPNVVDKHYSLEEINSLQIKATPKYIYNRDKKPYGISKNKENVGNLPTYLGVNAVATVKIDGNSTLALTGNTVGDDILYSLNGFKYSYNSKITITIEATDAENNGKGVIKTISFIVDPPVIVDSHELTLKANMTSLNYGDIDKYTITATPKYVYNGHTYLMSNNDSKEYGYRGVSATTIAYVNGIQNKTYSGKFVGDDLVCKLSSLNLTYGDEVRIQVKTLDKGGKDVNISVTKEQMIRVNVPEVNDSYSITMSPKGTIYYTKEELADAAIKVTPKYTYNGNTYFISSNGRTDYKYRGVNAKTTIQIGNGDVNDMTPISSGDSLTYKCTAKANYGETIHFVSTATDKDLNPQNVTDTLDVILKPKTSYSLSVVNPSALDVYYELDSITQGTYFLSVKPLYKYDSNTYGYSKNVENKDKAFYEGVSARTEFTIDGEKTIAIPATIDGDVFKYDLSDLPVTYGTVVSCNVKVYNLNKEYKNVMATRTLHIYEKVVDSYEVSINPKGDKNNEYHWDIPSHKIEFNVTTTPKYIYNGQTYFISDNKNIEKLHKYKGVSGKTTYNINGGNELDIPVYSPKDSDSISGPLDLRGNINYGDVYTVTAHATDVEEKTKGVTESFKIYFDSPVTSYEYSSSPSTKEMSYNYDESKNITIKVIPAYKYDGGTYYHNRNEENKSLYKYKGVSACTEYQVNDGTWNRLFGTVDTAFTYSLNEFEYKDGDTINIRTKVTSYGGEDVVPNITDSWKINVYPNTSEAYDVEFKPMGTLHDSLVNKTKPFLVTATPKYIYNGQTYLISNNTNVGKLHNYNGVTAKTTVSFNGVSKVLPNNEGNVKEYNIDLRDATVYPTTVIVKTTPSDLKGNPKEEGAKSTSIIYDTPIERWSFESFPTSFEDEYSNIKKNTITIRPVYHYDERPYYVSNNVQNQSMYKYRGVNLKVYYRVNTNSSSILENVRTVGKDFLLDLSGIQFWYGDTIHLNINIIDAVKKEVMDTKNLDVVVRRPSIPVTSYDLTVSPSSDEHRSVTGNGENISVSVTPEYIYNGQTYYISNNELSETLYMYNGVSAKTTYTFTRNGITSPENDVPIYTVIGEDTIGGPISIHDIKYGDYYTITSRVTDMEENNVGVEKVRTVYFDSPNMVYSMDVSNSSSPKDIWCDKNDLSSLVFTATPLCMYDGKPYYQDDNFSAKDFYKYSGVSATTICKLNGSEQMIIPTPEGHGLVFNTAQLNCNYNDVIEMTTKLVNKHGDDIPGATINNTVTKTIHIFGEVKDRFAASLSPNGDRHWNVVDHNTDFSITSTPSYIYNGTTYYMNSNEPNKHLHLYKGVGEITHYVKNGGAKQKLTATSSTDVANVYTVPFRDVKKYGDKFEVITETTHKDGTPTGVKDSYRIFFDSPKTSYKMTFVPESNTVNYGINDMLTAELIATPVYRYDNQDYYVDNNEANKGKYKYKGVTAQTEYNINKTGWRVFTPKVRNHSLVYSLKDIRNLCKPEDTISIKTTVKDMGGKDIPQSISKLLTIKINSETLTESWNVNMSPNGTVLINKSEGAFYEVHVTPTYNFNGVTYYLKDNDIVESYGFKGVSAKTFMDGSEIKVDSQDNMSMRYILNLGDNSPAGTTFNLKTYATESNSENVKNNVFDELVIKVKPSSDYKYTMSPENGKTTWVEYYDCEYDEVVVKPVYQYDGKDYYYHNNDFIDTKFMYEGVSAHTEYRVNNGDWNKYPLETTYDDYVKGFRYPLSYIYTQFGYDSTLEFRTSIRKGDGSNLEPELSGITTIKTYEYVSDSYSINLYPEGEQHGKPNSYKVEIPITVEPIYTYNKQDYHISDNANIERLHKYQGVDVNVFSRKNGGSWNPMVALQGIGTEDVPIYQLDLRSENLKFGDTFEIRAVAINKTTNKETNAVKTYKLVLDSTNDSYEITKVSPEVDEEWFDIDDPNYSGYTYTVYPTYVFDGQTYTLDVNTENKDKYGNLYKGVSAKTTVSINGATEKLYHPASKHNGLITMNVDSGNNTALDSLLTYNAVARFKSVVTDANGNPVAGYAPITYTAKFRPHITDYYTISVICDVPEHASPLAYTNHEAVITTEPYYFYNEEKCTIDKNTEYSSKYKYKGLGAKAYYRKNKTGGWTELRDLNLGGNNPKFGFDFRSEKINVDDVYEFKAVATDRQGKEQNASDVYTVFFDQTGDGYQISKTPTNSEIIKDYKDISSVVLSAKPLYTFLDIPYTIKDNEENRKQFGTSYSGVSAYTTCSIDGDTEKPYLPLAPYESDGSVKYDLVNQVNNPLNNKFTYGSIITFKHYPCNMAGDKIIKVDPSLLPTSLRNTGYLSTVIKITPTESWEHTVVGSNLRNGQVFVDYFPLGIDIITHPTYTYSGETYEISNNNYINSKVGYKGVSGICYYTNSEGYRSQVNYLEYENKVEFTKDFDVDRPYYEYFGKEHKIEFCAISLDKSMSGNIETMVFTIIPSESYTFEFNDSPTNMELSYKMMQNVRLSAYCTYNYATSAFTYSDNDERKSYYNYKGVSAKTEYQINGGTWKELPCNLDQYPIEGVTRRFRGVYGYDLGRISNDYTYGDTVNIRSNITNLSGGTLPSNLRKPQINFTFHISNSHVYSIDRVNRENEKWIEYGDRNNISFDVTPIYNYNGVTYGVSNNDDNSSSFGKSYSGVSASTFCDVGDGHGYTEFYPTFESSRNNTLKYKLDSSRPENAALISHVDYGSVIKFRSYVSDMKLNKIENVNSKLISGNSYVDYVIKITPTEGWHLLGVKSSISNKQKFTNTCPEFVDISFTPMYYYGSTQKYISDNGNIGKLPGYKGVNGNIMYSFNGGAKTNLGSIDGNTVKMHKLFSDSYSRDYNFGKEHKFEICATDNVNKNISGSAEVFSFTVIPSESYTFEFNDSPTNMELSYKMMQNVRLSAYCTYNYATSAFTYSDNSDNKHLYSYKGVSAKTEYQVNSGAWKELPCNLDQYPIEGVTRRFRGVFGYDLGRISSEYTYGDTVNIRSNITNLSGGTLPQDLQKPQKNFTFHISNSHEYSINRVNKENEKWIEYPELSTVSLSVTPSYKFNKQPYGISDNEENRGIFGKSYSGVSAYTTCSVDDGEYREFYATYDSVFNDTLVYNLDSKHYENKAVTDLINYGSVIKFRSYVSDVDHNKIEDVNRNFITGNSYVEYVIKVIPTETWETLGLNYSFRDGQTFIDNFPSTVEISFNPMYYYGSVPKYLGDNGNIGKLPGYKGVSGCVTYNGDVIKGSDQGNKYIVTQNFPKNIQPDLLGVQIYTLCTTDGSKKGISGNVTTISFKVIPSESYKVELRDNIYSYTMSYDDSKKATISAYTEYKYATSAFTYIDNSNTWYNYKGVSAKTEYQVNGGPWIKITKYIEGTEQDAYHRLYGIVRYDFSNMIYNDGDVIRIRCNATDKNGNDLGSLKPAEKIVTINITSNQTYSIDRVNTEYEKWIEYGDRNKVSFKVTPKYTFKGQPYGISVNDENRAKFGESYSGVSASTFCDVGDGHGYTEFYPTFESSRNNTLEYKLDSSRPENAALVSSVDYGSVVKFRSYVSDMKLNKIDDVDPSLITSNSYVDYVVKVTPTEGWHSLGVKSSISNEQEFTNTCPEFVDISFTPMYYYGSTQKFIADNGNVGKLPGYKGVNGKIMYSFDWGLKENIGTINGNTVKIHKTYNSYDSMDYNFGKEHRFEICATDNVNKNISGNVEVFSFKVIPSESYTFNSFTKNDSRNTMSYNDSTSVMVSAYCAYNYGTSALTANYNKTYSDRYHFKGVSAKTEYQINGGTWKEFPSYKLGQAQGIDFGYIGCELRTISNEYTYGDTINMRCNITDMNRSPLPASLQKPQKTLSIKIETPTVNDSFSITLDPRGITHYPTQGYNVEIPIYATPIYTYNGRSYGPSNNGSVDYKYQGVRGEVYCRKNGSGNWSPLPRIEGTDRIRFMLDLRQVNINFDDYYEIEGVAISNSSGAQKAYDHYTIRFDVANDYYTITKSPQEDTKWVEGRNMKDTTFSVTPTYHFNNKPYGISDYTDMHELYPEKFKGVSAHTTVSIDDNTETLFHPIYNANSDTLSFDMHNSMNSQLNGLIAQAKKLVFKSYACEFDDYYTTSYPSVTYTVNAYPPESYTIVEYSWNGQPTYYDKPPKSITVTFKPMYYYDSVPKYISDNGNVGKLPGYKGVNGNGEFNGSRMSKSISGDYVRLTYNTNGAINESLFGKNQVITYYATRHTDGVKVTNNGTYSYKILPSESYRISGTTSVINATYENRENVRFSADCWYTYATTQYNYNHNGNIKTKYGYKGVSAFTEYQVNGGVWKSVNPSEIFAYSGTFGYKLSSMSFNYGDTINVRCNVYNGDGKPLPESLRIEPYRWTINIRDNVRESWSVSMYPRGTQYINQSEGAYYPIRISPVYNYEGNNYYYWNNTNPNGLYNYKGVSAITTINDSNMGRPTSYEGNDAIYYLNIGDSAPEGSRFVVKTTVTDSAMNPKSDSDSLTVIIKYTTGCTITKSPTENEKWYHYKSGNGHSTEAGFSITPKVKYHGSWHILKDNDNYSQTDPYPGVSAITKVSINGSAYTEFLATTKDSTTLYYDFLNDAGQMWLNSEMTSGSVATFSIQACDRSGKPYTDIGVIEHTIGYYPYAEYGADLTVLGHDVYNGEPLHLSKKDVTGGKIDATPYYIYDGVKYYINQMTTSNINKPGFEGVNGKLLVDGSEMPNYAEGSSVISFPFDGIGTDYGNSYTISCVAYNWYSGIEEHRTTCTVSVDTPREDYRATIEGSFKDGTSYLNSGSLSGYTFSATPYYVYDDVSYGFNENKDNEWRYKYHGVSACTSYQVDSGYYAGESGYLFPSDEDPNTGERLYSLSSINNIDNFRYGTVFRIFIDFYDASGQTLMKNGPIWNINVQ